MIEISSVRPHFSAGKLGRWIIVGLMLTHAALLAWAATSNSATYDEYAHLPAGVAYWKHWALPIYNLSPPLVRMLGSWPAVLDGAIAPPLTPALMSYRPASRHFDYGSAFMTANRDHFARYLLMGRFAMIPVAMLGVWITSRWAGQLYGVGGAVIAAAVYAFSPGFIAHGALVTTDSGTTIAMLAAVWTWWQFCRSLTAGGAMPWKSAAAAVVTVAIAHLCKFTAFLLWPAMVLVAVSMLPISGAIARLAWRRVAGTFVFTGVFTLIAINTVFLFYGTGAALGQYKFESDSLNHLQQVLPAATPVPLPRDFVLGFDAQKFETEGRYLQFLDGETYRGNRWDYWIKSLCWKTPLAGMALALMAAISVAVRSPAISRDELALLLVAGCFGGGLVAGTAINIGVRYLMPAFPLLFILIGRLWGDAKLFRGTAVLLLLGFVVESMTIAPHDLTFFNAVAGGPSNGWRLLTFSDFDWCQGLIDLRKWMKAKDVDRVTLGYMGRFDPTIYGVNYSPLSKPQGEQYVAISTFFLTGMPQYMATPAGPVRDVKIPYYRELRQKTPVATPGYVIFVYRATDVDAAALEHQAAGGGG